MTETTRDLLEAYAAAVRATERARVDAAACGTQRDFERMHRLEDVEADALTKLEAHVEKTEATAEAAGRTVGRLAAILPKLRATIDQLDARLGAL